MQFGRALGFPFRDRDGFRKVLSVAALLILPVLGSLLATGWSLEACRRVVRRTGDDLPEVDFRRHLADGLAVWGIALAGAVPAVIVMALGSVWESRIASGAELAGAAIMETFWYGIECAVLAAATCAAVWATAAVGRYADTGRWREAFRLRAVFRRIRSAPAAYLLAVLAWIPLGIMAVSGAAVCGVGMLFTTAYASACAFHLAGQAYALAESRVLPASKQEPA